MTGLSLLFLFGLVYSHKRCQNMTIRHDKECESLALSLYNYTINDIRRMTTVMRLITENRIGCHLEGQCPMIIPSNLGQRVNCLDGMAKGSKNWECNNIDLLAFVPLSDLGGRSTADGNDIWGWYDKVEKKRYVFAGLTDGVSIVDITDALNPIVLCYVPGKVDRNTIWRDFKIARSDNGEYILGIVADASNQGLQYVPLTSAIATCRNQQARPYTLVEGKDYGWVGSSGIYDTVRRSNTHNIVGMDQENEDPVDTKLYLVGSSSCSGGLLAVDFANVNTAKDTPIKAGCFNADGYTHDAECWTYTGPDKRYDSHRICVAYNEDTITIVDYTDDKNPKLISKKGYDHSKYTHQGWKTSDQRYLLMNDELDEDRDATVTTQWTYIVDITNLEDIIIKPWKSVLKTIDHNLYIKKFKNTDYVFESNYKAGLRVLTLKNIDSDNQQERLKEVGYFKTWLNVTNIQFDGAWSTYPYFNDDNYPGLVVVQDINTGLYILDACKAIEDCP